VVEGDAQARLVRHLEHEIAASVSIACEGSMCPGTFSSKVTSPDTSPLMLFVMAAISLTQTACR
jgi:hypothetical protein